LNYLLLRSWRLFPLVVRSLTCHNRRRCPQCIAITSCFPPPRRKDTLLRGNRDRQHPAAAWNESLEISVVKDRVREIEQVAGRMPVAITDGPLSPVPHNANPILLEWLAAVYHACCLNITGGRVSRFAPVSVTAVELDLAPA
jgi:hypothetical protein